MHILVESLILKKKKDWALLYAKKGKQVLFKSHSVATVGRHFARHVKFR